MKMACNNHACMISALEFDDIRRSYEDFFSSRIMYAPVKMVFVKELQQLLKTDPEHLAVSSEVEGRHLSEGDMATIAHRKTLRKIEKTTHTRYSQSKMIFSENIRILHLLLKYG